MPASTLLYIAEDSSRSDLVSSVREDGVTVLQAFDASSPARKQEAWAKLLQVAHHGSASEVRIRSIADLPGGVWAWVCHLAVLGSLGLQLKSLEEPWLCLDEGQARLLRLLRSAHDQQRRERIRDSLKTARGKVGRPRVEVDVAKMAEHRRTHSLRSTAKAFGIGASTCHRILTAYSETQRNTASKTAVSR